MASLKFKNPSTGEWEKINAPGTLSFNGRSGVVLPANGDYTAEMVGAIPNGGAQIHGDYQLQGAVQLFGNVDMADDATITLTSVSGAQTQIHPNRIILKDPQEGPYVYFTAYYDSPNDALLLEFFGEDDRPIILSNIKNPIRETDAATKQYVDQAIANAIASLSTTTS